MLNKYSHILPVISLCHQTLFIGTEMPYIFNTVISGFIVTRLDFTVEKTNIWAKCEHHIN